jgi:hypothetical protein
MDRMKIALAIGAQLEASGNPLRHEVMVILHKRLDWQEVADNLAGASNAITKALANVAAQEVSK